MHTPFAPHTNASPANIGVQGWLEALSRLGLGLDAGLMNLYPLEVPVPSTDSSSTNAPPSSPEAMPYTRPGSH